jgi:hypothetical protein
MRRFRLQSGLTRAVLGDVALPLGLRPLSIPPPTQGYTVEYTPGEEDEPDAYVFQVLVSHELLAPLVDRMFGLLPDEVCGIVEIGSRDAYRSLDVYMAQEPIPFSVFRRGWEQYEAFLLEDSSIGVGANGEEPFVEIFLDQWKTLVAHVPLLMRDDVEQILGSFGLEEVASTWPVLEDDEVEGAMEVRSVLALDDAYAPDVDELLLQLRHAWQLELNVDPSRNVDEANRELGRTLWHATLLVESIRTPDDGAYASIWATARSLEEMDGLIRDALSPYPQWRFLEIFTIDRVPFDERPDELGDLPPRPTASGLHLVEFEPWSDEGAIENETSEHDGA